MKKYEIYKNNSRIVVFMVESAESCSCCSDIYQLHNGERIAIGGFYLEVEIEKSPNTDVPDWLTHVLTIYYEDTDVIIVDDADDIDECTVVNDAWEYYSQFSRVTLKFYRSQAEAEEVEVEPAKEEL